MLSFFVFALVLFFIRAVIEIGSGPMNRLEEHMKMRRLYAGQHPEEQKEKFLSLVEVVSINTSVKKTYHRFLGESQLYKKWDFIYERHHIIFYPELRKMSIDGYWERLPTVRTKKEAKMLDDIFEVQWAIINSENNKPAFLNP